MRHGRAEHARGGALRVDMDPLIIAGHRGKLVDTVLIDGDPVADANLGTNQ